jgi:hypothetical protein
MDKYIKVEKELAELLGVFDKWEDDTYSFNGSMKWARNNDDAFKLLLRYGLEINYITLESNQVTELKSHNRQQMVQIRRYIKDNPAYGQSQLIIAEYISEHQDVFAAVQYAIVCAVINILKENRAKIA